MKYLILITIVILVHSFPAHAVVIGDKDWRQVTDTVGYSWLDMAEVFDTESGQCKTASCSLGSTDLSGYTWANSNEIESLFTFYTGIIVFSGSSPIPAIGIKNLLSDFDSTIIVRGNANLDVVAGFTRDDTEEMVDMYSAWLTTTPSFERAYQRYIPQLLRDIKSDQAGGWFYKSADVPSPSTIILMSLGLVGLVRRGK